MARWEGMPGTFLSDEKGARHPSCVLLTGTTRRRVRKSDAASNGVPLVSLFGGWRSIAMRHVDAEQCYGWLPRPNAHRRTSSVSRRVGTNETGSTYRPRRLSSSSRYSGMSSSSVSTKRHPGCSFDPQRVARQGSRPVPRIDPPAPLVAPADDKAQVDPGLAVADLDGADLVLHLEVVIGLDQRLDLPPRLS